MRKNIMYMDEIFDNYFNKNQYFSEEIINHYRKLNENCEGQPETAILNIIEAYSHIHSERLTKAISLVDAILNNNSFDPQAIYFTRNIYFSIYHKCLEIAKNDISNVQIGSVLEALFIRGLIGIEGQVVLADHYEATGLIEKANLIREKITNLFPNYFENI